MGHEAQGIAQSRHRYQVIPRTLSFVTHGDDVLLLRGGPHKRLWAGLYNGVGGHIEAGEDVFEAARREISEETGLAVDHLRLGAIIHADANDPNIGIMIFTFLARAKTRKVVPSAEGTLEWVPRNALPGQGIVEDLPVLLPRLFALRPADPPLFLTYRYDENDRLVIAFAPTEKAHDHQ
jgi:8-oxo-dGTP diphosphatase